MIKWFRDNCGFLDYNFATTNPGHIKGSDEANLYR